MSDESILHRLEEQGHPAPRVTLAGSEASAASPRRYEFGEALARGGVGAIHRGRDNDVGRDVALKVLHEQHVGKPEFVQRFVEEAQIGGQLQHPGIVPVYELGLREDNRPFFAMKLVKGKTLAALLVRRGDAVGGQRRLLGIFRDLCRTMSYAHARGVVHRDLKPANVMVGSFGEIQVVDWGLAKVLRRGGVDDEMLRQKAEAAQTLIATVRSEDADGDSLTGSVMGTPAYMPPEQALGQVEDLDEQSDVFSLGAILCEILTGKPPYVGTPGECLAQARAVELDDARTRLEACDADPALTDLCLRCLEPQPDDRPRRADELADEVAAHLAAAEERAHRAELDVLEARTRAETQSAARRQTRLLALGGVAAAILGVAAWLWIDLGTRARARERNDAIQSALEEATRLRAAGHYSTALIAARRARDLGGEGELAQAIEAQAATAEAETARVRAEDTLHAELERLRGEFVEAGRALASGAELVHPARAAAAIEAAYESAFVEFGGIERAAVRLQGTRHASDIAAAVSHWAYLRRTVSTLKERPRASLHALVDALDPDNQSARQKLRGPAPEDLDAWIEAEGESLPTPVACGAAFLMVQAGRQEEALAHLRTQYLKHPEDPWIQLRLARVADHLGETARGLDHALAAATLRPRFLPALLALGRARLRVGSPGEALTVYERALALRPDSAVALMGAGIAELELDRAADAALRFELACARQPEEAIAWRNLGLARAAAGDDARACEAFEQATTLDPAYAKAFDDLGLSLLRTGETKAALAAFRRGVAADPEVARLHVHLADALVRSRSPDEAVAAAEQAVRAAPLSAAAHAALGRARLAQNAFRSAKRAFQKALTLDGRYAPAWTGLGGYYEKSERYRKALECHERAVGADPEDPRAREAHGQALLEGFGRVDDAVAQFRAALEVEPGRASAQARIIEAYSHAGDWKRAREAAQVATAMKAPSAAVYRALGKLYSSEGRAGSARRVEALEQAYRIDPEARETLEELALALLCDDRLSRAQQVAAELEAAQPAHVHSAFVTAVVKRWMYLRPLLDAYRRGERKPRSEVELTMLAEMLKFLEASPEDTFLTLHAGLAIDSEQSARAGVLKRHVALAGIRAGEAHYAEALRLLTEDLEHVRTNRLHAQPRIVYQLLQLSKTDRDLSPVRDGPDVPPEWQAYWKAVDEMQKEALANIR